MLVPLILGCLFFLFPWDCIPQLSKRHPVWDHDSQLPSRLAKLTRPQGLVVPQHLKGCTRLCQCIQSCPSTVRRRMPRARRGSNDVCWFHLSLQPPQHVSPCTGFRDSLERQPICCKGSKESAENQFSLLEKSRAPSGSGGMSLDTNTNGNLRMGNLQDISLWQ